MSTHGKHAVAKSLGHTPVADICSKAPPFQLAPGLHWLTTAPNPRSPMTGWDAGQRGWRTHAVEWTEADNKYHRRTGFTRARKPSLCGLSPAHGWGADLFIEQECERCLKKYIALLAAQEAAK